MGDSDSDKKVSIPDWQKKDTPTQTISSPSGTNETQEGSEAQTLETAKKFLDEESIRNEPIERKIAFLQKKGLQDEVIQKLLGADIGATSQTPLVEGQVKTVYDSTHSPIASTTQKQSALSFSPPISTSSADRDIPPIITYPEFLLRPQKPPPLVTVQRLVYAAYGLAGLSTLTYAASKYVVQPMLDSLTAARLELADITLQDLQKLNTKLEANVSHVPYASSKITSNKKRNSGYVEEDAESIDSDPTELFHRDFATQTSPCRSRSSSTTSVEAEGPDTSHSKINSQASSLNTLRENLKSLVGSDPSNNTTAESLKETVSNFQTYLNTLQLSGSSYRTDYNSIYGGSDIKKVNKASGETEEATKLKAEIRALKGVFLSSRNFPQGRPMVGTGATSIKG